MGNPDCRLAMARPVTARNPRYSSTGEESGKNPRFGLSVFRLGNSRKFTLPALHFPRFNRANLIALAETLCTP